MHIHNVYFWLQDGLDRAAMEEFEQGLAALCADGTVSHGHYGQPAGSDRAVVDSSYTYGLVLQFADTGKHDEYQVCPTHDDFVTRNAHKWTRLQVYDVITA